MGLRNCVKISGIPTSRLSCSTLGSYKCSKGIWYPDIRWNRHHDSILSISNSVERYPASSQTDCPVRYLINLYECLKRHTIPDIRRTAFPTLYFPYFLKRYPTSSVYNAMCFMLIFLKNIRLADKPTVPAEHSISLYKCLQDTRQTDMTTLDI